MMVVVAVEVVVIIGRRRYSAPRVRACVRACVAYCVGSNDSISKDRTTVDDSTRSVGQSLAARSLALSDSDDNARCSRPSSATSTNVVNIAPSDGMSFDAPIGTTLPCTHHVHDARGRRPDDVWQQQEGQSGMAPEVHRERLCAGVMTSSWRTRIFFAARGRAGGRGVGARAKQK